MNKMFITIIILITTAIRVFAQEAAEGSPYRFGNKTVLIVAIHGNKISSPQQANEIRHTLQKSSKKTVLLMDIDAMHGSKLHSDYMGFFGPIELCKAAVDALYNRHEKPIGPIVKIR